MELFRLSLGCICLLPWLEALLPAICTPYILKKCHSGELGSWENYLCRNANRGKDWCVRSPLPRVIHIVWCSEDTFASAMHITKPRSDCTAVAEGQGFLIRNTRLEKCIRVSHHETNGISLTDCKAQSPQQKWSWDPTTKTIVSLQTKQCLSAHKTREYALVKLEPCGDWERQAWSCSKKGRLTLQSLGFHLSTKEGGHKVFVSREKDKLSRWKTLEDETICTAAQRAAPRPSKATQQAVDTHAWIYETKTINSSKIDAVDASVSLSVPPLATKFNSTVSPAKTKQAYLPANEGEHFSFLNAGRKVRVASMDHSSIFSGDVSHNHSKKHHGNRGKSAGARLAGTNWKTAMLVLSPLAFILGLIILTLNVHYNKKKKILSALKSSPANNSRADLREPPPLRRGPQPYHPPSRSPSLRRGEILIEWKDGTVTPLFDNANYQMD